MSSAGSGEALGSREAGSRVPGPVDVEAAAAVLARLTAPLPRRRGPAASRASVVDRDQRLRRALRVCLHHLDAGAVTPPAAAGEALSPGPIALFSAPAAPSPPGTVPRPPPDGRVTALGWAEAVPGDCQWWAARWRV